MANIKLYRIPVSKEVLIPQGGKQVQLVHCQKQMHVALDGPDIILYMTFNLLGIQEIFYSFFLQNALKPRASREDMLTTPNKTERKPK